MVESIIISNLKQIQKKTRTRRKRIRTNEKNVHERKKEYETSMELLNLFASPLLSSHNEIALYRTNKFYENGKCERRFKSKEEEIRIEHIQVWTESCELNEEGDEK